jgi:hypothetical protein
MLKLAIPAAQTVRYATPQCRGPCLKQNVRATLIQHTRVARMRMLRFI